MNETACGLFHSSSEGNLNRKINASAEKLLKKPEQFYWSPKRDDKTKQWPEKLSIQKQNHEKQYSKAKNRMLPKSSPMNNSRTKTSNSESGKNSVLSCIQIQASNEKLKKNTSGQYLTTHKCKAKITIKLRRLLER